jgi:flagellar biosynthesis/type III secretory pathway protein FliH
MFDEMHAYDAVIAENYLKGKEAGKAEGFVEGEAKGKAKGKAEGKAEGKVEGKTEGHADAISVMQAMGLPPEKIAEAKARLDALKSK